jgi:flagellar hook-length control protein FliK
MLERTATASPITTARPASAGGVGRDVKDDSGFQDQLREALEPSPMATPTQESAPQGAAAPQAKPVNNAGQAPQATAKATDTAAPEAKGEKPVPDGAEGAALAAPALALAPELAVPEKPVDGPAVQAILLPGLVMAGQGLINPQPTMAAAPPNPTVPGPDGVATALASAAPAAAVLINGQPITAQPNTMAAMTGQTTDLASREPEAAQVAQAAVAQLPPLAGEAAGAKPAVQVALPGHAEAASTTNQPRTSAETLPSRAEAASTTNQPHIMAETLIAAPLQAAAQAAPAPRPAGTQGKVSATPLAEALQSEKPASPASLLAQALGATDAAPAVKIVTGAETAEAVLHLTAVEAPKAAAAKPGSEARAEAPSLPLSGFAVPETQTQRAEAPQASAAVRDMAPPPPPARQLAPVVVSLALGRGDEALTIALDPVELGRVEVSIGQGREAGQVRIVAERPETLALLQRDQRELDRALNQAGLGDMARSMSFSLASDQGRQQHHGTAHQGGQGFLNAMAGRDADQALAPIPIPAPARAANSLIDIAV